MEAYRRDLGHEIQPEQSESSITTGDTPRRASQHLSTLVHVPQLGYDCKTENWVQEQNKDLVTVLLCSHLIQYVSVNHSIVWPIFNM